MMKTVLNGKLPKGKNGSPFQSRSIALLLSLVFVLALSLSAYADEKPPYQSVVDGEGNQIVYTGDMKSVISIPAEVDGKPVQKIGDRGFYGKIVRTVYLEDGIKAIGTDTFAESALDYIHIPASVKTIGDGAFRNCRALTSFALESDETEWGKESLAGTGYLHIGVPCTLDLEKLQESIREAKGDEEFAFDVMHVDLVESMVEKDIYGRSLMICNACGYRSDNYAGGMELPFQDVSVGTWYYPYVLTAYSFGILNGRSEEVFAPEENMTLAEAAKIAACVHLYLTNGTADFKTEGGKWYEPYVAYCYQHNIIDSHMVFEWGKTATRGEMAYLFSRADTSDYEINPDVPLSDIPDVNETNLFAWNILTLYRRGIAVGSNQYYAYYPDANVKRSEAAAFISRILCYDMRVALPKG